MVVADPSSELVQLVTELGDPAPVHGGPGGRVEVTAADRSRAELLRRRFGLALPAPFAQPSTRGEPVRIAVATDGPAIAAVKWRVFGTNYRGVLPDDFLDRRDVVPPASFWTGRAMVPPSRRHRLLVWGRPGTVFGYADLGPAHADDDRLGRRQPGGLAADHGGSGGQVDVGEVYELYVDPSAQGLGAGTALLAAAEAWLDEAGFDRLELSVLARNTAAQRFYRANGWEHTGRVVPVDLGVVAFEEHRYARQEPAPRS